jgi:hypothetical protein
MFLRRCERRKSGKRHTYWALVESYRTARGSRQRVVAYLGDLTPSEQDGWAKLGAHLQGDEVARRPQRTLFDPPCARDAGEEEQVKVRLKDIRLERLRDFGDVWLAWGLWRMLGLDGLLAKLLPEGREDVSWGTVAAILAIARFCEPSSELHIEQKWYRRTALEDLLGVSPEKVHTDRLYAALDRLLPHKEAIESHLKQRFGELFALKCDLLLYDVTSTYFEGDVENCEIAKRGYSRDSRGDRPQVCIGLVVTEEGFPLGYEVFAGNMHDSLTVKSVVESLDRKHGALNRVWVMDRGMVSNDNLKFLRERGAKYIVGTPKAIRAAVGRAELGGGPERRRCEARSEPRWPGDVPSGAERRSAVQRTGDAREVHRPHADGPRKAQGRSRVGPASRRDAGRRAAGSAEGTLLAGIAGIRRHDQEAAAADRETASGSNLGP